MMALLKRHWMFVASAALLLVYGVVFAFALTTDTSAEYRDYFIDRSSDCWEQDVDGAALGEIVSLAIAPKSFRYEMMQFLGLSPERRTLLCGWIGPEQTGAWSSGPESRLRFRLPATGPVPRLRLVLLVAPFVADRHPRQRVSLSIAGRAIGEFALEGPVPKHFALDLPAAAVTSRVLDIVLAFSDARSPADLGVNRDRRRLAIRMLSMRLETTGPR